MKEKRLLMWFIYCELFNFEWSSYMKPIIKKYGCIINALKAYNLYWLWRIVDDIDSIRCRVSYHITMWLRKHYFNNL